LGISKTMKVSVILPTYNERENIIPLIESLSSVLQEGGHEYQIVVVDDNSPDGTAALVEDRFCQTDRVKLIWRNGQRGLGTAVKVGIKAASGDILVVMDADLSHDPHDVPLLISGIGEHDLVNGSRYMDTGGFQSNPKARISSMAINWFIRLVLGLKTTDSTIGFLAVKRSLLNKLNLENIFYGYGDFHFRLLYDAFRNGASVKEVPVVHRLRQRGEAKTRLFKDGCGYVISALKIRLGIERPPSQRD
jgi:dolichol-phosphate mannosyltransferase